MTTTEEVYILNKNYLLSLIPVSIERQTARQTWENDYNLLIENEYIEIDALRIANYNLEEKVE